MHWYKQRVTLGCLTHMHESEIQKIGHLSPVEWSTETSLRKLSKEQKQKEARAKKSGQQNYGNFKRIILHFHKI